MDFSKLRKIESPSPRESACPTKTDVSPMVAILHVVSAGYRPKNVKIRAIIDDHLFTAEFPPVELANLEADPQVASISPARAIPLQKAPVPRVAAG